LTLFPFESYVVVIKVDGKSLRNALENAVSKFPVHEGRFPQISGMKLTFNPKKKAGERITQLSVAGKDVEDDKIYTLATTDYLAEGHDGFDALANKEYVVDLENGMLLSTLMRLNLETRNVTFTHPFLFLKSERIVDHLYLEPKNAC